MGCVAPRFSSFRVIETGDNANRTPFAITLHLGLAQFPLALSSHSQFYQLGVVLEATHAVDLFLGLQCRFLPRVNIALRSARLRYWDFG